MDKQASLTERVSKAIGWQIASSVSALLFQFAVGVILARLLPVVAFGLIGAAMVVIGFANVMYEMGMSAAVIQRLTLTTRHIRVGFTLSVLSGVVLASAIWLGAPYAASFFANPGIIPVIQWLSVSLVIKSVSTVSNALLQRRLAFRELFWVDLASYTIGYAGVGITVAYSGGGVWALVWASIAESTVRTVMLMVMSPHSILPCFARDEMKDLLSYGIGLTMARIANYVSGNGDNAVVGRWLGVEPLGLYARAFQLFSLPLGQLTSILTRVLFPAYSTIQNHPLRLQEAYKKSVMMTVFVAAPVLAGMVISAPEIMNGVFGAKWGGAIVPFQILCVGGVFKITATLSDAVARAKGAVYKQLGVHIVFAILLVFAAFAGTRWGLAGVATGVVCSMGVMYLMMAKLAQWLTEGTWRGFFVAQSPGIIVAIVVAIVGFPVTYALRSMQIHELLILGVSIIIYALTMITTVFLFRFHVFDDVRQILTSLLLVLRRQISRVEVK